MSVIVILLIVSIVIAGGFLVAFFWSVQDGQYEDDYSPAQRILFDDRHNGNEDRSEKREARSEYRSEA